MENFILFVGQALLAPFEWVSQRIQLLTGYNNFSQARMSLVVFRILILLLIAFSILIIGDIITSLMLVMLHQILGWAFRVEIDTTEAFCVAGNHNIRKDNLYKNAVRTLHFLLFLYLLTSSVVTNRSWGLVVLFGMMNLIYFLLDCYPLPPQPSLVRIWTNKLFRRK